MRTDTWQGPLPVKPVDDPIICSPYEEPNCHYEYVRETGEARRQEGRRTAEYWYKTQERIPGQPQLALELAEERRDLVLVNRLREDLRRWRKADYEGATPVTKDLLRHWWRKDRGRRLFFCQLEAAESIIFLSEIRGLNADGTRRRTRWNPNFLDDDFKQLLDRPADSDYPALVRACCKMATGSGKTVVMAMLIAWALCNRGRVPSDERFPRAALVVCPNLTVKERLQVLRTDTRGSNYYTEFDIVPTQYRDLLRSGKVLVTNWHLFAPESEHCEGGKSYGVVNKGPEDDDAFAQRVLGDLYDLAPVMVLNDEGHHAYRPAPLEKKLRGDEAREAEAMNREATIWVSGLDRINNSCGIRTCVDLSATPFYIKGSGYPDGEPFPWLVSDFGLVDAIESGITKIPRLPVSDTTGRPEPKYFRLWHNITRNLLPAERLSGGKPKPDVVWAKAQDALLTLAGEYKKMFAEIDSSNDLALKVPPAMIIVCDNTDIAEEFYRNISGEVEVEVEEPEDAATDEAETDDAEDADADENGAPAGNGRKAAKPKKRIDYTDGKVFPELLQNGPAHKPTLRIDSKLLAKIESEDPDASKEKAAAELRAVVNTVGKAGQPGEQVRCVVSVQMLSEGWDANNVTHILGLRAFGSQLLCEQVVGRGLRRMNYTPDPETGMLVPEYVDVYGIPFSVIPFKGKPKHAPPPPPPPNHVKAIPERAHYAMRFPNVEGYVFALRRNLIKADVSAMEPLLVQPGEHPTATFVKPAAGYQEGSPALLGPGQFVEQNRQEYYATTHLQGIEFEISRQVVWALVDGPDVRRPELRYTSRQQLFPQVLRLVHEYVSREVNFAGTDPRELGLDTYVKRIVERLLDAIVPDDEQGEPPLMPLLNRHKPIGTTADVDFMTTRQTRGTERSHINQVVLDAPTWESCAAFYLEQARDCVEFYARNDHLGLVIPYEYLGVPHSYEPDFLVRLSDGRTILLEVKGFEDDQTQAKHQAAQRWVLAVNNWGKLGRWEFVVCREPHRLPSRLRRVSSDGQI